jgi:superfamily I DNA/RNA helicase
MPPHNFVHSYATQVARLNEQQRAALLEPGNTVVLAGPGSGKTATLVLRIARLLDEVRPPQGVACITYGTEAAKEFESRLHVLGIRKGGPLFLGTVHAFCLAHILRPFGWYLARDFDTFEVASDAELARARQRGLDAANINEDPQWWTAKISAFRQIVSVEPARCAEFNDERLPTVALAYKKALREARRIDFDDIVLLSLRLVQEHPYVRNALAAKFPWLVVDEYQDLGLPLHRIVTVLIDLAGVRVFAVGDPDQSIYGFNGARPEFLDAIAARRDVRAFRLRINYRCRQNIIDASLHVLQPDVDRGFSAVDDPSASDGEITFHRCDEGLEQQAEVAVSRIEGLIATGVEPGDIGILGPRWDDVVPFTERLRERSVPFRIARASKYKATPTTQWVEGMARWCSGGWETGQPRLRDLFAAWDCIIRGCGGRGLKALSLNSRIVLYELLSKLRQPELEVRQWFARIDEGLQLRALTADTQRVPPRMRHDVRELGAMIQVMDASRQPLAEFSGLARDKVVLQTIHGSKGLEYSAVFIPALEKGVLPKFSDEPREARRLFYVALTRARHDVHLLWSGFWHTAKGYRREEGPSIFLAELAERLREGTD